MNKFKLKAKIVERNTNVEKLAEEMRISPTTLYRKIRYPLRLTLKEVIQLKDLLEMTNEEAIEIFLV